jgi:exodeoxyribonuclease VII large subunit
MQSLTVGQLALHMKMLLESDPILCDVWVSGEISNLNHPSSGHYYFTVKDEQAQLRCALFRQRQTIASVAALEHGAQVLVHGYVSFYEARGDLQLYADTVQPAGIGVLAAEFERLCSQLEAEGLFAVERKRPLPCFPRKVGVVTSATGAVFHDICTVLGRRWPLVEVVLAPTLVQGDGAGRGIVQALAALNRRRDIDVIVVARGGGSLEDLWAFNEEQVARAIYASRIPVVSAVGHETDFTIADFVADCRAATPSAAAELIVPDQFEVALHLGARMQRLRSELQRALDERQHALEGLQRRLSRCRPEAAPSRAQVTRDVTSMRRLLSHQLALREERLSSLCKQLAALSPAATLGRGYALVQRGDGALIVRAADARAGERVEIRMADGGFDARVEPSAGDGPAVRNHKVQAVGAQQSRLF